MPELPEVEIIKKELSKNIKNLEIKNVFYSGKKFKRPISGLEILSGQKISNIYRRNKYIVFETNNLWLVFHLGMTGNLLFSKNKNNGKHVHLEFKFNNESYMSFQDPRRFGSFDMFKKETIKDYLDIPLFLNLGLEPLSEDFTISKFKEFFSKEITLKKFLMDAKFVCGIGNIYANEIMFLCNLNPNKKIKEIRLKDQVNLYEEIKKVLNKAIELGGSSISDFVHTNGLKGEMQNFYKVYGRNKQSCFNCDSIILKQTDNGRGTYYCPTCQK